MLKLLIKVMFSRSFLPEKKKIKEQRDTAGVSPHIKVFINGFILLPLQTVSTQCVQFHPYGYNIDNAAGSLRNRILPSVLCFCLYLQHKSDVLNDASSV